MLPTQIITTQDGSFTLRLEDMNETYHSTNGALTEALHVYIKNGLNKVTKSNVSLLEIGFGTGLNALVTLDTFLKQDVIKQISYTSLEKYPISQELAAQLNYGGLLSPTRKQEFAELHEAVWNKEVAINPQFSIYKKEFDLINDELSGTFDLIYYDAFAPSKQAEMWTEDILKKVVNTMNPQGIFITYCVKGDVRRALNRLGLTTQRLPGPPGKLEILFAYKD